MKKGKILTAYISAAVLVLSIIILSVPDAEGLHPIDIIKAIGIGEITSDHILDGDLVDADISGSADIKFNKMEDLASGKIIVGSGGNKPKAVSMTGDVTISDTGVTTIGPIVVTSDELADTIEIPTLLTVGGSGVGIKAILSGSLDNEKDPGTYDVTVTGAGSGDPAFCTVSDPNDDVTFTIGEVSTDTVSVTISGSGSGNNTDIICIVFDIT